MKATIQKRGVKLLGVLLAAALLITALPLAGLTASAADMKGAFFVNGTPPFAYVITGLKAEDGANTVKLYQDPNMQSYDGYTGLYAIPERVFNQNDMDYYSVTEIGGAVSDSVMGALQNVSLRGLELPSTISVIGDKAFAQCTQLQKLSFPTSVKSLAPNAFLGVTLQELTLNVVTPAVLSSELSYTVEDGASTVVLPQAVTDLLIAEPLTVAGNVSISGGTKLSASVLTVRTRASLSLAGPLTGTGTVEVAANGSLTVASAEGFTGSIKLNDASSEFENRSAAPVTVLNAAGKSVTVQPGETVRGGAVDNNDKDDPEDPALQPKITTNYGGSVSVKDGGKSIEITVFEGYHVEEVVINGLSMGPITRYEFAQASNQNTVSVTFAAGSGQEGPDRPTSFIDVPSTASYAQAVNYLTELGMLQGVGGDRFAPERKLTRAELVALVKQLELRGKDYEVECEEEDMVNPFHDVAPGKWYTEAVTWAVNTGVWGRNVNFYPKRAVTREEVALCLYRYTKARGYAAYVPAGRYHSYRDSALLSYEARQAMTWAATNRYLTAKGGMLNPASTMTRGEMAETLARYLQIN